MYCYIIIKNYVFNDRRRVSTYYIMLNLLLRKKNRYWFKKNEKKIDTRICDKIDPIVDFIFTLGREATAQVCICWNKNKKIMEVVVFIESKTYYVDNKWN